MEEINILATCDTCSGTGIKIIRDPETDEYIGEATCGQCDGVGKLPTKFTLSSDTFDDILDKLNDIKEKLDEMK